MKLALLFSGQGAQYPGMLKDLYESESASREVFPEADRCLKRDISKLCFSGTQEVLNLTHNTQPCVLAADLAVGMALKAHGVIPEAAAGFSLGEYAALVYADALEMQDAFPIIQIRADAMQEAVPVGAGAMAAVLGVDASVVEALCSKITEHYVAPANYNSPVQTVISGTAEGVDLALAQMEAEGIRAMKLAVSAPFHCALMEPAAKRLEREFAGVMFCTPSLPVYMNVTGEPVREAGSLPELLVEQAMSPVRWRETLENMHRDGFDTFIECGPGRTLSGLVKKTLKGVNVYRVENQATLDAALKALNAP